MNVFSCFVDFGHVLAPFSWYTILRYRDALEQVFRWKFKFIRIYHIKIWSFFAYSKHLFFFCIFSMAFQPSNKQRKTDWQRCGFEGVLERDRARRISKMELRCFAPSRTVGFGRVFLMHTDAFGELTVRHQGMLELEPRCFWIQTSQAGHNPTSK